MIIYLIGYMGSGKTTVGKKLAKQMDFDFVDMDQLFEERYKISVDSFFNKYDETAFRNIESELISEVSLMKNIVVSTGGGAPCFHNNLEIMLNSGKVIYLKMTVKSLVDRLINAKNERPLIKGKSVEELSEYINTHLQEREPSYLQAHIVFKGENCDMDKLVELIKL